MMRAALAPLAAPAAPAARWRWWAVHRRAV